MDRTKHRHPVDQHSRIGQLLALLIANRRAHEGVLTNLWVVLSEPDECPSTPPTTRLEMCFNILNVLSSYLDEIPTQFTSYCQRELMANGELDGQEARRFFSEELERRASQHLEWANWEMAGPAGAELRECRLSRKTPRTELNPPLRLLREGEE